MKTIDLSESEIVELGGVMVRLVGCGVRNEGGKHVHTATVEIVESDDDNGEPEHEPEQEEKPKRRSKK